MFRRFKIWKIVVILILFVIVLQIFHMSLLNRLENKETLEFKEINKLLLSLENQIKNPIRLDKSGNYHVIPDILMASSRLSKNSDNLTIVTQCTSNHLHNLVDLTERWHGSVSVSVFTYSGDVENTIRSIVYYHMCYPSIHKSVTFHVVFPVNHGMITSPPSDGDLTCESLPTNSAPMNYALKDFEYPHNLLRNYAIMLSRTSHILVIDIDMIPSSNLGQVFTQLRQQYSFLKHSTFTSSAAYVIPAFEVKDGHSVPIDKEELLYMWNKGTVRPFYSKACWKCQKYTDYEKWRSIKASKDSSYRVDWKDPWEPFYIAAKTMPLYDERFKQYGFNRISQVCELHIAGFQFIVLSDAFLVHKGFKRPDKFHSTKNKEQEKNRLLFRQFKEELKLKYEATDRRCY